ncbi:MAG: antitoxin Xre/MbcA/ParS toxin-binding domain-containing protein [Planctomycetota bacterium]
MATAKTKSASGASHLGSSLGLRATTTARLIEKVEQGIGFDKVHRLRKKLDVSQDEMARLLSIPVRTLDRRQKAGRLNELESDRLLRLARVFEAATELFGGDEKLASAWLKEPARALGNVRPLDMARSDVGAREVEQLIGRIGHGVFT